MNSYIKYTLIIFFYTLLTYLSIVLIDIFIPRYMKLSDDYKKVKNIISKRIEESKEEIENFKKDGFRNQIYVVYYDNYPISKILKKNNFAPISPPAYTKYILCNEGHGIITYTSDRFGFRNRDYLWDSKEINTVIVGDSFAEGQCVGENYTFSGILNNNDIRTVQLANGGMSTLHYEMLIKIFIPHIKPENLIIILYENDNNILDNLTIHKKFSENLSQTDYLIYQDKKLALTQKYKKTNEDIIHFLDRNKQLENLDKYLNYLSKLKKYLLLSNIRTTFRLIFRKTELIGSNRSLIDTAISICKEYDCTPQFVLLQASDFWDPGFYYETYKAQLSNYLKKYNLDLITFDAIINHKDRSFYGIKGPHFSPKGYNIVSNEIIKLINKN